MTIDWKATQKKAVYSILQQYPAEGGQCDAAAEAILPIAKELDGSAQVLKIVPSSKLKRARFIIPVGRTAKWGEPWYVHYMNEVMLHYVDALTGPDGTVATNYLQTHWEHPDDLEIHPV
ncbi:hypothetical protein [Corallococcus terminator]|uniref:hypothetical protein n=1 Tax=Corallococcus terminator TaxID=2316733 RepID=UPI0011C42064|nr:hypothetical protein [Corallococcus terminator]